MSLLVARRGSLWTPKAPSTGSTYADEVLADGPTAYWRLGESSGTTAADETGNWDGTYVNSPTLGEPGAIAGDSDTSVLFDSANNERVDCGQPHANHSEVTLECWVKTTATGTREDAMTADSDDARNWQFYVRAQDFGQAHFTKIGSGITHLDGTIAVNDGDWHHIVGTYDGSTMRLYVDGVEDVSTAASGAIAGSSPAPLRISSDGRGNDQYFDGHIDEAALYDYALTSTRVADHYSAGTA